MKSQMNFLFKHFNDDTNQIVLNGQKLTLLKCLVMLSVGANAYWKLIIQKLFSLFTEIEVEIMRPKSGIAGDERNVAVLLFLYVLQGIPLGLAAAVPLILTNRHVSYREQVISNFLIWPKLFYCL